MKTVHSKLILIFLVCVLIYNTVSVVVFNVIAKNQFYVHCTVKVKVPIQLCVCIYTCMVTCPG